MGMIPAGSFANRSFCDSAVSVDEGVDGLLLDLLADAQTSGGLLAAVAPDRASALHEALEQRGVPHPEIGSVTGGGPGRIKVVR
jgi:selenide,water dikinase